MAISRSQRLFGKGPAGAVISFLLVMTAIYADHVLVHSEISADPVPIKIAGGILAVLGFGLHFWSMWTLRNWWVKDELCTKGPFRWFRHPMYAAWISFIIPSLALYLNSWILLFTLFLIHPIWHKLVSREEKMMSEKFQDEYRVYAARTGRFFPRVIH